LQARHRAKNAVIDTDVLAEHDHVRIILTSAIVLSREFAALRGIDLGQISIEVIEHGCGPARCRCQVAFSRRLDEAGAFAVAGCSNSLFSRGPHRQHVASIHLLATESRGNSFLRQRLATGLQR
jgi:hypothetical protein